jgi:hypothetical protein
MLWTGFFGERAVRKTLASIALALALSPLAAGATTLFDDDFAAEVPNSPGVAVLNFGSLTQWDITDGAVDLFTNGGFGLPCGSAGCLDLDGSVQNAVRMETKASLAFVAGDVYQMTLVISGKNGNGSESLSYGIVGGPGSTLSMPSGDNAGRTVSFSFLPGVGFSAKLYVDHAGRDNAGILLDRVTVTGPTSQPGVVPLPATLPLAVGALASLGLVRARRRA